MLFLGGRIMINQQWLETFLTLVEVGHFTQTAEKLHMTQPGVSQHIKKLEDEIGVPLLNRVGKKFELTRAGEMLSNFGHKRLEEEEQLFRELQFDSPNKGECRFGCSGAMATLLYPHFLKRQKSYPELIVSMEAAPNNLILQKIISNELDIGIVTQSSRSSDLEYTSIGFESLCLVLPKKYSRHEISIDKLDGIGFINHPDGLHYVERVLSANFKKDFRGVQKLKIKGYVNQINQILTPVAEGVGYTVLPENMVQQFKPYSSLFIVPIKTVVQDELFIVRKKHGFIAKRYKWFEEEIRRLVAGG